MFIISHAGPCSCSQAQMPVVGHPESPQLDPLSVQPLTHFHFLHLVSNERSLRLVCIFRSQQDWLLPPPSPPHQSLNSSHTPSFRSTVSFFFRDNVPAELSPFPIGHCPCSCHSVPDSKIISKLNLPRGSWVIASASCSNNSL